jgi:hypothetical protein
MMRPRHLAALLALAIAGTACAEPTEPERHSLLGRWRSEAVSGATIEMVLSESARTVTGAGRWVAGDTAVAFDVSGTNTGESVSLLFEFGTSPMLNFLGDFVDEDTLEGTIVGAGMGSQPARLLRQEEDT